MSRQDDDWFTCPVCGEVVPAKALACPECGADDETGWSELAEYDGVSIPDEAFGNPGKTTASNRVGFMLVALALVLLVIVFTAMGFWGD